MLAPLQPIVLLILKWGVRGSTSHGHVYMYDNFQIWSYIYIFKLLIHYLYLCSRGVTSRTRHREVQGSSPVRVYSLFLVSFFFSFAFFVWKFDVLFVGLFVVFSPYGHSKQTRSLLLLDLYYSAWRSICDSYHRFYPRPENPFHVM